MDEQRTQLYQSIVAQLEHDGLCGAAAAVAGASMIPSGHKSQGDSSLFDLFRVGQRAVESSDQPIEDLVGGETGVHGSSSLVGGSGGQGASSALDLSTAPTSAPRPPQYTTRFITTHKAPCRVARFNHDGTLVATGSTDTSIKVLDVGKMLSADRSARGGGEDSAGVKPVLRTLYNHTQPVTDLDWHPYAPILLSCGKDNMLKFFDCSKAGNKHPYQGIQDTHNVLSATFHPSGDFVFAGTEHNMVHIYDVKTLQCYTPSNAADHHVGGLNQVRCSSDGKQYASAGKDGAIKLWDVVSNTCVGTLAGAHDKMEVTSVAFSKSAKYLLSAGRNSTVVLWDLAARRPLLYFKGHRHARHRSQACFSHNEEFVVSSDDGGPSADIVAWSARTAELLQRSAAGHTSTIRWVAHSPVAPHFVTCSEDFRARLWVS